MEQEIDLRLVEEAAGDHVQISLVLLPFILSYYAKIGIDLTCREVQHGTHVKLVTYLGDRPYMIALVPSDSDVLPTPAEKRTADETTIKTVSINMVRLLDRLLSLLTLLRALPLTLEPLENTDNGSILAVVLDLLDREPRYIPLIFLTVLGTSADEVNRLILESTYSSLLVEYVKKGEKVLEKYNIDGELKRRLIEDGKQYSKIRENARRELESLLRCSSQ